MPDGLREWVSSIREQNGLCAFSDSSWTAPKSVCGYCVMMAGGPIAFSSRKLNLIADSSAMSEYSAGSACTKEVAFVRNLLNELGFTVQGPVILGVDNVAAIKISEDRGATKLTKHFDFAAYRLRDECEHLRVRVVWTNTELQTADIFTKALDSDAFYRHRKTLLR